jgi:IS30 family transposase
VVRCSQLIVAAITNIYRRNRGKKLSDHRRFTLTTNIDVYFCDSQSPWQRGSNENSNGLLRQYFPRGTDLSVHSQAYLNKVARKLNERPRETLQFETPAEGFNVLRRPVEPALKVGRRSAAKSAEPGASTSSTLAKAP